MIYMFNILFWLQALFLSSVKSDESDITDEEVRVEMEHNIEKQKPLKLVSFFMIPTANIKWA